MTRGTSVLSRSDVSCDQSDEDTGTSQQVGEEKVYQIELSHILDDATVIVFRKRGCKVEESPEKLMIIVVDCN